MLDFINNHKRTINALSLSSVVLLILNVCTQTYPINLLEFHSDNQSKELRVMCWNIYCRGEGFDSRQSDIALRVLNENPDFVFLCEYARSRTAILDSILSQRYTRYYVTGSDAAFYSKLSVEDYKEIAPMKPSKHSLNVMGTISDKGVKISIVGVHLSSSHHHVLKGIRQRDYQVDAIANDIRSTKSPIIILGDFNDLPGSNTLRKFQKLGFRNAWWDKGNGFGGTYHGCGMSLRIDHILYNEGIKVKSIKKVDGQDLSDHDALVAEFLVE